MMIELPEYVWEDIWDTLGFHPCGPDERFEAQQRIDRLIEIVDMERARQLRDSMKPPRPRGGYNARCRGGLGGVVDRNPKQRRVQ